MGPGDVIGGKYEVVRFLGKGGMGMVLEARHKKLEQRVAIKVLLPDALTRPDSVARFEREARAAALLKSQYVVRVLDVDNDGERGGTPFIVMEYLEGHDAQEALRRREKIPVTEAVDWLLQACIAMAEAHANGIVHRDLKPSNLFLVPGKRVATVKVMDFGISKLVANPNETDLTTTETTLGTPSYMAPEQLMSAKAIDHRADIWALGVVMYRLLSGRLPFTAESSAALAVAIVTAAPTPLARVAPHVPAELAAVVARTMERDPANRPQDAVALGRLLLPFGSGVVPFEASIKGLAPPKAPISEPKVAALVPIVETTVVDNATTDSAWSHRGSVAPRSSALPIVVAAIAGLVVVGALAVGLFVVKRPPAAPPPSVIASSAPSATEAPPPPVTDTAPVPAPPPTAAAPPASVVEAPKPRVVSGPTAPKPVKSAAPTPTANTGTSAPNLPVTPEKDPLHL